ncbi:MAG: N-methyl-L-tryptophan oxidase [Candidatus Hydrogenedentes bacterium]|nr:N-methyl-L-tryptophan oxidase [Candidatus Hydrogenedentota bacterium]
MTVERYDAVVFGLGGMGSAALYHLAKRGARVCGVERFGVAHDRGSSHGETRVIRKAYFEHSDYVPLLNRAYTLWEELEAECGEPLLVKGGAILAGKPNSELILGLERCYREHSLPHERLDAAQAQARYPEFRFPGGTVVFVDPSGGYLFVERCIEQHLEMAERHGAVVSIHEDVTAWKADDSGVTITTDKREIQAGALIITAGAWTSDALDDLGVPLRVLRKVQLWYDSPSIGAYSGSGFPVFYVESDGHGIYGVPAVSEFGMKLAEHTGGATVDDPDTLNRGLEPDDEQPILRFIHDTFPNMEPRRTRFSVCMYTVSPDEHFIIDQHPRHANVVIGAGFSGHGFKFASVVGEILAQLALDRRTSHPIDFLRLKRFQKDGM